MATFITSDTHFGHKNLCKGTTEWTGYKETEVRNFANPDEMNEVIINNINSMVGVNDTLYHLGDFGMVNLESLRKIRERINCKDIRYLIGNHDKINYLHKVFGKDNVKSYDEIKVNGIRVILFHYPIDDWNKVNSGSIMLHGHQHNLPDAKHTASRRMDIGVDGNNYFPYNLEDLIAELDQEEIIKRHH